MKVESFLSQKLVGWNTNPGREIHLTIALKKESVFIVLRWTGQGVTTL